MAQNGVSVISTQRTETKGGRQGGGKTGRAVGAAIGGVVGGLAGAAATTATGGAAAPTIAMGAAGGAATGAGIGQEIGERIKPAREAETSAIGRRLDSTNAPQLVHSEQSAQLRDSLVALKQQPMEIQNQYAAPLIKAYIQSVATDNQGTGMA